MSRRIRRTIKSVSTSSTIVLSEGAHGDLRIQNTGSVAVYLGFGETPTADSDFPFLNPGAVEFFYTDQAVNAIVASGTGKLVCLES